MSVTADEAAVKKAVDDLIKALLAADKAKLEAGVGDQLSFGHADGHIQDKADFVAVVASKKAIYRSVTFIDQPTVTVMGNNAIVRYTGDIEVEAGGRVISLKLAILQVWMKDGGAWKLLAHQGAPKKL